MANLDIALIVIVGVVFLVIVFASSVLVYTYQHPDEYGQSYFYKIVVVLGFTVACVSILMLPLDVANTADSAKGFTPFPMDLLWLIIYLIEGGLLILVIPFLMWFYETENPNPIKRFFIALAWELIAIAIFVVIMAIMYSLLGYTDIPVYKLTSPTVAESAVFSSACGASCIRGISEVTIRPTIVIYFIALITWVGWLFFIVFGGIGLMALPMDLINDFRTRPKDIKNNAEGKAQYLRMRKNLNERSAKLLEQARKYKEDDEVGRQPPRRKMNKFRTDVYVLERDWDYFNFYNDQKRSPIYYYFRLFLGILSILVSLAWIVHIILYDLLTPPVFGFLNPLFTILDSVFPLFGTLAFGIFAFYLVWCVVKGAMKFGFNLLIITIHPLVYKGTLMNAFLFNVGMVIISTYAVMQFCAQSFNDYAHFTSITNIFGNTARYLRFLKYFYVYNIYIYCLLGFALLSTLYLCICSGQKRREKEMDAEFQRIRDSKV